MQDYLEMNLGLPPGGLDEEIVGPSWGGETSPKLEGLHPRSAFFRTYETLPPARSQKLTKITVSGQQATPGNSCKLPTLKSMLSGVQDVYMSPL